MSSEGHKNRKYKRRVEAHQESGEENLDTSTRLAASSSENNSFQIAHTADLYLV